MTLQKVLKVQLSVEKSQDNVQRGPKSNSYYPTSLKRDSSSDANHISQDCIDLN